MKINVMELFKDALPVIEKFSPTIGGAIGGVPGFAIGYLIPILANAFGSNPGDIKQLVSNIINDPNAQQKLQQIENDHCDLLCSIVDNVDRLTNAEINIKLAWSGQK